MITETRALSWCPWMTYVWTTKELEAWYRECGPCAMYNGYCWKPETKRLVGKMHSVRFVKEEYSK